MKVRDVMTYGVISVSESASIAEAIETMLRSRVSALVVFDADHALSGILSEGDLLRHSELGSEPKRPYWLELLIGSGRLADAYAHEHGRKAGEVMTRDVETITEDAELSEAVDRMIHRRIKRLPVLRGETLVGIVSRSDLLKGLLTSTPSANAEHSDAEIKAAILAELDKLEWAPRASVSVEVQNGVVTFDGSIIDERLRSALKVIAENTPGCVAFHDHMAWIEPNSGVVIPSEGDDQGVNARALLRGAGAATAGGEKEGNRPGRVRLDLRPQGGEILAEQRSHQHRQHHQIEKPARRLRELFLGKCGRNSDGVGCRQLAKNARHRFCRALAAHAADARRQLGKPACFGNGDPDEPDRLRGQEARQDNDGKRVEPLLD